VFVRGGNVTAWRDAAAQFASDIGPVSVTLTTVPGDLVIKVDTSAAPGTPPSLSAGFTNGLTAVINSLPARLSYRFATSSSEVCASEDEFYSTVVAFSIPIL